MGFSRAKYKKRNERSKDATKAFEKPECMHYYMRILRGFLTMYLQAQSFLEREFHASGHHARHPRV